MKKLYTLLLFTAVLSLSSYGQLEFYVQADPGVNYTGGTYEYTLPDTNQTDIYIDVMNPTGMDSMFIVSRRRISPFPPASWQDGVCWQGASGFGLCIPYFGMDMEYYQLNAGNADQILQGTPAELKPQIKGDYSDPGTYTYRYYVGTAYNPLMDSIDLSITLDPLSVPELSLNVGVHPNPASDYITVDAEGISNADLKVMDVLGNTVLETQLSGSTTIDVAEYRNGIYFVIVTAEGRRASRKVVVRN